MHLDLAGIFQLVLDALCQLTGQDNHLVLADLLGLDHDADLAACLDGIGLIYTLEGTMRASIGDYIIKGVNEELYPCKPDIFNLTYEKVE